MFRVTTHCLLGKTWTEAERMVVREGKHAWESVGRTPLIDVEDMPSILHAAGALASDLEALIHASGVAWDALEALI